MLLWLPSHLQSPPVGTRVKLATEVRDLILRANRQGSNHGLPLSYITHECVVLQFCSDLQAPISIKLLPKVVGGSSMLLRVEETMIDFSIGLDLQVQALRACGCHHVSWSLLAIAR